MEQVIRTYGRFLLEVFVFAGLMLLLFAGIRDNEGNRGIFHMIGAQIGEREAVSCNEAVESYRYESQKSAPVITCINNGMVYIGSHSIDSLLRAVDCRGEELPIHVSSICNPGGEELTDAYSPAASWIQFDIRGVYTLKVTATDAWNRRSICTVRIPVNSQEEAE